MICLESKHGLVLSETDYRYCSGWVLVPKPVWCRIDLRDVCFF